jgi:hypothetical protein
MGAFDDWYDVDVVASEGRWLSVLGRYLGIRKWNRT